MSKSIISEGKTSTEAIEKGLKELHVSKNMVDIKILENEDKRSFFSILAPRVVKVEITVKENIKDEKKEKNYPKKDKEIVKEKDREISLELLEEAKQNTEKFLKEFIESLKVTDVDCKISIEENHIRVDINGDNIAFLIGYRGDTLNAFQTILSSIANQGISEKIKVILDIEKYRSKREKTLEDLAEKISKTVLKTGKSITLEPMSAYERKIIHSKLQNNNKVKTYSIGEEPYRKVVIAINK
ncbi:MAG: RNA-binding cell elongation regulator Jag/EloR [Clostridia bacterium]|jgi:protein jag